jgi:hypothetical protein
MNEFRCLPMKSILQIILTLGLTLFICSNEVCGQQTGKLSDNWVSYMKNYQGNHYYDKDSIIYPFKPKSIIRVWTATIYTDEGRDAYIQDLIHRGIGRDTISRMRIDQLTRYCQPNCVNFL